MFIVSYSTSYTGCTRKESQSEHAIRVLSQDAFNHRSNLLFTIRALEYVLNVRVELNVQTPINRMHVRHRGLAMHSNLPLSTIYNAHAFTRVLKT